VLQIFVFMRWSPYLISLILCRRLGYAAACTINDYNVFFTMLSVFPGHKVSHVCVWAISRAAHHGRITPVSELIEIVLHTYATIRW